MTEQTYLITVTNEETGAVQIVTMQASSPLEARVQAQSQVFKELGWRKTTTRRLPEEKAS